MNDPHKFGTGFKSDHALERSTPIVSHHDTIKWFEAIPGEQSCIRVHGTQVNGRYAIMENIAAPGTATPMHFHAEDEIFHILEGTVTFSIDGDLVPWCAKNCVRKRIRVNATLLHCDLLTGRSREGKLANTTIDGE
jgi:hypothetical protein